MSPVFRNGDVTSFDVPIPVGNFSSTLASSPPLSDNSTQVATTEWVRGQGYVTVVTAVIPAFADAEVPSGAIDGVNVTFTLISIPKPLTSLQVFLNGVLQLGTYTVASNTITLNFAPQSGDTLVAYYRH